MGVYTIQVDGRGSTVTDYQFELVDVPETTPVEIAIGDIVTGEIAVAGEVDVYEFVSDGNNRVFLTS